MTPKMVLYSLIRTSKINLALCENGMEKWQANHVTFKVTLEETKSVELNFKVTELSNYQIS